MADDLALAQPITLPCGLTFPNRLIKVAMTEQIGDSDNLPDEQLQRLYAAWAEGGWGMMLTGNVQVDVAFLGSAKDTSANHRVPEARLLDSWKSWAAACNRGSTPALVQLSHPGRQTTAGKRSFFTKALAPSAVPLVLGAGIIPRIVNAIVFGTPKEMTVEEIHDVVQHFVRAAKAAHNAGFAGVQIHAAHGYLLADFLSSKVNLRTDDYGGTAAKRARLVVEIIQAVRAVVPAGFCVGLKLNSVDHQSATALQACVEQLEEITKAGIDFLEISGGTYEDPAFLQHSRVHDVEKSDRTKAREAFFLEFASAIRERFRQVPLIVTGGFRSRLGMEAVLRDGVCDMVGIGRPAVIHPDLPKSIVLNAAVPDEEARVDSGLRPAQPAWLSSPFGIKAVGAGQESMWYQKKMRASVRASL